MTDSIKPLRKGKKITPAAEALDELLGEADRRRKEEERKEKEKRKEEERRKREEEEKRQKELEERRKMEQEFQRRKDALDSYVSPDDDYGERAQLDIDKGKQGHKVISTSSYIRLLDIVCKSALGDVFDVYNAIYVARDVQRRTSGMYGETGKLHIAPMNTYEAIEHFDKDDGTAFLPSSALTCNILLKLLNELNSETLENPEEILFQYKDLGSGQGWHVQNTIIRGDEDFPIIHYPSNADFTECAGSHGINIGRRNNISGAYKPDKFKSAVELEVALTDPETRMFLRNLTGLRDPKQLMRLGNFFGKSTTLYKPPTWKRAHSVWIGCTEDHFVIDASSYLNDAGAVRGVFEKLHTT